MKVHISTTFTEADKQNIASTLVVVNGAWFTYLALTAAALFMVGCGHAETELGNQLGCHLAGNGCSSQGATGAAGPQGPTGAPGAPGIDGTSVSIVKLCPEVTTYPHTFAEIAFCVGNKLYATYSSHGGFSTEIPPGSYQSNAVGSQCTFTVHANCVITN